MSAVTLYHAPFSTCSQKVRYALWSKDIPFDSRPMSLQDGEHLSDWYLALNPNGVVPTLQHKGAIVHDSSVICEYLDEVFPDRSLTPSDPLARARMRAWMRFFEEVPTTAIRAPSFNAVFIHHINKRPAAFNADQRERMPLRKHFYEKMGVGGFSNEVIEESAERLDACIQRVDAALSKKGPFLLGSSVTIADIVLLPTVVRMEDLGMAAMWAQNQAFTGWYALMQDDPAFAKTFHSARVTPQRNQ